MKGKIKIIFKLYEKCVSSLWKPKAMNLRIFIFMEWKLMEQLENIA